MQDDLPNRAKCPFCWEIAGRDDDWALPGFSCDRCGNFRVEPEFAKIDDFRSQPMPGVTVAIAGWIQSQNAVGIVPQIYRSEIKGLIDRPQPTLRTRAMLLLRELKQYCHHLNVRIDLHYGREMQRLLGVSYSADHHDLRMPIAILRGDGFVNQISDALEITIEGFLKLEAEGRKGAASSKAFVAMNFDKAFDLAWTSGFAVGISAAGYTPFRINEKEFIGGITDEIISEIKQSKFLIADYSGHKNGVYFEAGYALGSGLDVIQSCQADHLEKLHFDIKHINTIVWNEPNDLAYKLEKRIRAVMGAGPDTFVFPWAGGRS